MKRVLSLALALVMMVSLSVVFSGCGGADSKDFPVKIGDVTIADEPKNIVVLSDCLADVISYIGYDVKMVGKSVDCDQEYLKVVPSVGAAENPALDMIAENETDLVIADSRITEKVKKKLTDSGVDVVVLEKANSFKELKKLYQTLGMVIGGNVTGKKKGVDAYNDLLETFSTFSESVTTKTIVTDVYLYMNEEGQLCSFKKGSIESELMDYNKAVDVLENAKTEIVNEDELRMSTPTYIFYDGESVLEYLKNDPSLSNMSALRDGRTCQIPLVDFSRQGVTYEALVYKMMELMFIKTATPDDATPDNAQ